MVAGRQIFRLKWERERGERGRKERGTGRGRERGKGREGGREGGRGRSRKREMCVN